MLAKLIKHEFRSTARTIWPIMAGLAALSIMMRIIALPVMAGTDGNAVVKTFSSIILALFCCACFALVLAPLVATCYRFKKSILGDEGYLTMTLPVSSHLLLCSKLIVNAAWYALSIIMGIIAMVITFGGWSGIWDTHAINEIFDILRFVGQLISKYPGDAALVFVMFIEAILIGVAMVSTGTLAAYAAYSIGFSANKHKSLFTIILLYGFYNVGAVLGVMSLLVVFRSAFWQGIGLGDYAEAIVAMGILFAIFAAFGAVFYFITNYFITRRLNLE